MAEHYDIVVIGAGPGGFRAARRCAQKNAKTAVIEKEFVGGTCLNWGCIPSKALLASAHTLHLARTADKLGINIPTASPNWQFIQQRKDAIIEGFRKAMLNAAKANNMNYIQGQAKLTAPKQISIQTSEQEIQIETDKLILATGSKSIELPNIAFDGQLVISSKEALNLAEIPRSIVIVGGGVIGCEMACVYAVMGSQVTIVEALPQLIPMEDDWVARIIEREFKKIGINTITGIKVASVEKSSNLANIKLENGQTIPAEKVLVSVGRVANVDKSMVEILGLKMNGPVIAVNEKFETNVPGVYAIGDAIGTTYLAHGATAEAEVAAKNVTGCNETMQDYSLIPRVIFTFPEVASIGKSEKQCKADNLDVTIGKGFFKANGRSVSQNQTVGQIRVIRDNSTNKILGITMVGEMTTEFIVLARTIMGTTENLNKIVYPHPTVSETLEDAVNDALGVDII